MVGFRQLQQGVSIHVPARGTTSSGSPHNSDTVVSIHVPARGTTLFMGSSTCNSTCFNPRSRTGNDGSDAIELYNSTGFNPRSRTGNDDGIMKLEIYRGVSIHVPARGTTLSFGKLFDSSSFQSTFPHGERHI